MERRVRPLRVAPALAAGDRMIAVKRISLGARMNG